MANENRKESVERNCAGQGTGGGGTVLLSKKERGRTASLSLGLHGVPGRPSLSSSGRKCTCTCIYMYLFLLMILTHSAGWHMARPACRR